jgi:hypothetical protein
LQKNLQNFNFFTWLKKAGLNAAQPVDQQPAEMARRSH